jgi:hypothetical protein
MLMRFAVLTILAPCVKVIQILPQNFKGIETTKEYPETRRCELYSLNDQLITGTNELLKAIIWKVRDVEEEILFEREGKKLLRLTISQVLLQSPIA